MQLSCDGILFIRQILLSLSLLGFTCVMSGYVCFLIKIVAQTSDVVTTRVALMVPATVNTVTKAILIANAVPFLEVCCCCCCGLALEKCKTRHGCLIFLIFSLTLDRCANVRCGANARCIDGACQCESGYEGNPDYECRQRSTGGFGAEQIGDIAFDILPLQICSSLLFRSTIITNGTE